MKKLSIVLILFIAFGCSPELSTHWTKESYTDKSFSKIAIVGISDNLQARVEFEETAVERFKENGINAVTGIDMFPPNMSEEEQQSTNLIKIIKENELDGVITMALVDSDESSRYVPGESQSIPVGYRRFGKYYVRQYARIHTPGYYVPTKSYLIEAVLYDLKGELVEGKEAIVWTGQSSLVDPSSIESAAKSFTKKMVNHMVNNQVVTKK